MNIFRRRLLHLAAGVAALPVVSRITWAQTYPTRPVRMIVPFPPGGQIDIIGRLIGHWLSERLGQQFFVDNRPGAAGNIGTEAAVRAAADGHTLLLASVTNAVNATLFEKLNFDFIRDTAPVASINRIPLVLEVPASFPAKTVPELIAYAKANPGKINIATPPKGTAPYMAAELFMMMAGVELVHVPYRGSPPMLIDLFGGQVQVAFDGISSSAEHIRSGKLRALAVATAARLEAFPEIPILGEFVPPTRQADGAALLLPRTRPSTSSTSSTERLTLASPIPASRHDLPMQALRCLRDRRRSSAISLSMKLRSGRR